MKIHLDTTYLLPLIGVDAEEIVKEDIERLFEDGNKLYVNQISVFELCAKGAKYVAKGVLPVERVIRGVNALTYGEEFKLISFSEAKVLEVSFKTRRFLNDYIDCVILSSAVSKCDALVTEDEDILTLRENKEFLKLLEEINSKFKILSLKELLKEKF